MAGISVIVPVYKSRDYLTSCMESLCDQTMDDIEIVIVDDHGDDDSMELAHTFVGAYSGPKSFVFTQTESNAGPGEARNIGIRAASGEYVAFVDSDDFVDREFCSALYSAAKQVGADMAYCHLNFDYPGGRSIEGRNPMVRSSVFEGKEKRRYLLRYKSFFTTYIYKRAFLLENGICFPSTHSAEDSCFLGCCLLSAERIAAVDRPLYHYLVYRTSVSRTRDRNRFRSRLASFRHLRSYAKEKGIYGRYALSLRLISWKKGYLLAVRDFIQNNI